MAYACYDHLSSYGICAYVDVLAHRPCALGVSGNTWHIHLDEQIRPFLGKKLTHFRSLLTLLDVMDRDKNHLTLLSL